MSTIRFYLFFLFILILLFLGSFFIFTVRNPFQKPETYINTNQTAVIKQMRQLSRLETASFTIEKVIDAGTQGNAFQEILFGDKILLIAHGEVVAGFDFSTLSEKDVQVSDTTLTLTLPKPQILHTRIDNEKTRVYDRRQGLLSQGDKDLESKARLAAEQSIQEAACQEDILQQASNNARKQLTALFTAAGFTTVTITIPETTCP